MAHLLISEWSCVLAICKQEGEEGEEQAPGFQIPIMSRVFFF